MKLTEEEIRELAGIFDDIISSNSESVKSAFHRLAFLSSLASEDREEPGPFTDLVNRLDWMEREIVDLRRDVQILSTEMLNANGQQDLLNEIVDLSGMTNMASPTYLGPSTITLSPLAAADIITLSQSTLDGFNHGSS